MITVAEQAPPEDRIREILDDLVRQHQRMRGVATDIGLLEANRLAIIYWQRQLSRTLLAKR